MGLFIDDWDDSTLDDKYFLKNRRMKDEQKQVESEGHCYRYIIVLV